MRSVDVFVRAKVLVIPIRLAGIRDRKEVQVILDRGARQILSSLSKISFTEICRKGKGGK